MRRHASLERLRKRGGQASALEGRRPHDPRRGIHPAIKAAQFVIDLELGTSIEAAPLSGLDSPMPGLAVWPDIAVESTTLELAILAPAANRSSKVGAPSLDPPDCEVRAPGRPISGREPIIPSN